MLVFYIYISCRKIYKLISACITNKSYLFLVDLTMLQEKMRNPTLAFDLAYSSNRKRVYLVITRFIGAFKLNPNNLTFSLVNSTVGLYLNFNSYTSNVLVLYLVNCRPIPFKYSTPSLYSLVFLELDHPCRLAISSITAGSTS